ncbi:MAG: NAD-dependent DNA ligase LigA, partial [Coriobacteriaceae bacterium]|nr:NAD-dependent DNA ligase LigA [Coriobacteriaceae bacterium]
MPEVPADREAAACRAFALRAEVDRHNRLYHGLDAPEISDAAYDALVAELVAIETAFPDLVILDSPTQRVGAPPSAAFAPVRHAARMYSLDNAMSLDELDAWFERLAREVGGRDCAFVAELKIDGASISLTYEDGALLRAATRGDGVTGEDVTPNIRTIKSVPLRLAPEALPGSLNDKLFGPEEWPALEVRGEVYMSAVSFERLNEEQAEADRPLFANPRNAAAGALRQKDPAVTASRDLSTFIYQLAEPRALGLRTQSEALDWLRLAGFRVNPDIETCADADQVRAFCERALERRGELPYEI